MLAGAMAELRVGDRPLSTDVGPVIDEDARHARAAARADERAPDRAGAARRGHGHGTFFAPRAWEIGALSTHPRASARRCT